MEIDVIDEMSGKPFKATISEPPASFFDFVGNFDLSDERMQALIDGMNVTADTKAMLYSFSKATIKVGRTIVKIGRKILDFLFTLAKSFPSLTFGVIFGLVIGALIAAIPVIGAAIGGVATVLAVGFGVVLGGMNEVKQDDLGERVNTFLDQLRALSA